MRIRSRNLDPTKHTKFRFSLVEKKSTILSPLCLVLWLSACLKKKKHMRANCCRLDSWKCQTLLPICHSVHYELLCSANKRDTNNSTLLLCRLYMLLLFLILLRQSKECNNLCVAKYCYILFDLPQSQTHSYKYTQSVILGSTFAWWKAWSLLEFSKLILNNIATSRLYFS